MAAPDNHRLIARPSFEAPQRLAAGAKFHAASDDSFQAKLTNRLKHFGAIIFGDLNGKLDEDIVGGQCRGMCSMLSLLSLLFGGPVLAWVRTVYTRLSGTNDRAPFRPERTGNFPVAANETAADMLCCALYPRIQTFPSTDLHLHGWGLVSRGVV